MVLHLLGSLAQMEADMVAERTSEALRYRRDVEGRWVGRPPFGFKIDKALDKYLVADLPMQAELLRAVASKYLVTEETIVPIYRRPFRSLAGMEGSEDWWR